MTSELPYRETALLAATIETASNTTVPKENQTEFCLSCGAATPQRFCGVCGLKNDDLRRSLFKLITETLGSIFSFDGRMWRTWASLIFKPGKVAREYSDGRRMTYSPPIRVYLVITFLLLLYLAATQTNLFAVVVTPKSPDQIATEKVIVEKAKALEDAASGIKNASQAIIGATKINNAEALDEALEDLEDADFKVDIHDYNFELLSFQPQRKFDAMTDKASAEGFVDSMNNEEASKASGLKGESLDIRKAITIFLTNPIRFNEQFNIWLPRAMFFMVPMVMFFSVIYIRGPNAFLYDHLIHAIYIHSIFFMSLFLAILLSKVLNGGTVAKVLMISLLIYLPLSLKRMFGRGWLKTIWTTLNIGFIYVLMLTFVMASITAYSLLQLAS